MKKMYLYFTVVSGIIGSVKDKHISVKDNCKVYFQLNFPNCVDRNRRVEAIIRACVRFPRSCAHHLSVYNPPVSDNISTSCQSVWGQVSSIMDTAAINNMDKVRDDFCDILQRIVSCIYCKLQIWEGGKIIIILLSTFVCTATGMKRGKCLLY